MWLGYHEHGTKPVRCQVFNGLGVVVSRLWISPAVSSDDTEGAETRDRGGQSGGSE